MSKVSPEAEALISEAVNEIYHYRPEYLYQGLCATARDLDSYLQRNPEIDWHHLDEIMSDSMDKQPEWVLDWLEANDIPEGFAQSATNQELDLIDFDDPAIDHESVLYPGKDIFSECVDAYWEIICGERSVQSATSLVRGKNNKEMAKNVAYLLFGTLGTSFSWTPFISVFSCIVVHEGLDKICSDNRR